MSLHNKVVTWCLLIFQCGLLTSLPVANTVCTFTTTERGTHAQCNKRGLTRLPVTWPAHVTWLDASMNALDSLQGLYSLGLARLQRLNLSHNAITSLRYDTFQGLADLQQLDLSHNSLHTLPHDVLRGLTSLTRLFLRHTGLHVLPDTLLSHVQSLLTLDLSSNNLSTVPRAALAHTPRLQTLLLANNSLKEVGNYSFQAARALRTLDLQHNNVTRLQNAAFSDLGNLSHLDLSHNRLLLDSQAYPPGVFAPLSSLHTLYLHSNDPRPNASYGMPALRDLASLRTLSIDTFPDSEFGADFMALSKLSTLSLRGECRLQHLRNTTFRAFQHSALQHLYMEACRVSSVEACVFCHQPYLKTLDYVGTPEIRGLSLDSLIRGLYGLQNQNLTRLTVTDTMLWFPVVLTADSMKYFNTMCVNTISFAGTFLANADVGSIVPGSPLCNCLRDLDLSRNQFHRLPPEVALDIVLCGQSVHSLRVDNQASFPHWPFRYLKPGTKKNVTVQIDTPPELVYINVSAMSRFFGLFPIRWQFNKADKLLTLDVSYNGAKDCDIILIGLTSLLTLNISGNDCDTLNPNIFSQITTLRHLGMADMPLDPDYIREKITRLLQPLTSLQYLDFSRNNMYVLPAAMLSAQPSLSGLRLAGNRFQRIPIDLGLHNNLSLLDLSANMLTSLLPHERHLLDALAEDHLVQLRLRDNPLSCTCSGLDFVRWLALTTVKLDGDVYITNNDFNDNGRDFPCLLEDGRMSSTGAVMAQWDAHWRRCVGQTAFWAALVGLLLQLMGLVLTFVISRNWTYVCYAWRVLRHLPLPKRLTFRSDVILAHADRDLDLAVMAKESLRDRHDVRVLLPYDEIMPGELWAERTLQLVDDSWKILLLVTRNFLQDAKTGFLVHHAQCSITDTMPDRILILFLEQPAQLIHPANIHLPNAPLHPARVSLERLLRLVPDRNVFHVHRAAAPRHPVWDRLAELIIYH